MRELNTYIEHTLLRPDATRADIEKLCLAAREHSFASVCVNPCHVRLCHELLLGSEVKVCTVIGFPLGATSSKAKAAEAAEALECGCDEFDMVINVGAIKGGELDIARADIAAVRAAVPERTLKVIIETGLLTDDEKRMACRVAADAGADFVKTCTGFSAGSATPEDVALMRASIPREMRVKASGGIRTREQAIALIEAGADRLGTSSGIAIVSG